MNFQRPVLIGNLHVFPASLVYGDAPFLKVNKEKQFNVPISKMACLTLVKRSVAYS